jgi:hypothetical protein
MGHNKGLSKIHSQTRQSHQYHGTKGNRHLSRMNGHTKRAKDVGEEKGLKKLGWISI